MASKKPEKKQGKQPSYTAKDIFVLEGLEPVRKRPGMYIGGTSLDGLHHLIWEVVDNSIDEAMAGYAKTIRVELLPENIIAVTDDGRGIPVETHAQTKTSALETVMTKLHAGGKFGGESYKVSGGLHGVGVSVVNALSTHLRVEVCRDGGLYMQEYERGIPKEKVKKIGKSDTTGTKVTFIPDPTIFPVIEFDRKRIIDHLRQQSYLTKGIKIEIADSRDAAKPFFHAFYFDGGLLSFVNYLAGSDEQLQDAPFYIHKDVEKIEVEVACAYTEDLESKELSFANHIYTLDGGMHVTGFRSALTRVLNDYARVNNYVKKEEDNLTGDDVREGLVAIISIKMPEPQFEGQTKGRLGSPEARTAVEAVVGEALKEFLEKNSGDARKMIEKCLLAAKARKAAKAAKETVLRKGALEGLTLPGKLADCSSRNPAESELFVVEGDSAGGCFSGDTQIALVDGRSLSFLDLIEEARQGKSHYCYTIGRDGAIGIAKIESPRKTKKNVCVVEISLDNGEKIRCTPDHQFMLANGSYKPAISLTDNDSLMPLYRQYSKIGKRITIEGYEMVFDPKDRRWIFTHLLADQYNFAHGNDDANNGAHRHHKDFNKLNNNPDNIVRVTAEEHLSIHRKAADRTLRRPEVLEKLRALHQTPEFKKKIQAKMIAMRNVLSDRAKKQWENAEYKKFMTEKFMAFYNSNADYRVRSQQQLHDAQRAYWADEKNRVVQAQKTSAYFKKNPEKKNELSQAAIAQWANDDLKIWRSAKTREQWTPEFRARRKEAYSVTYYHKAMRALRAIYDRAKMVVGEEYETVRRKTNDKNLLRYDTIVNRFFEGSETKLVEAVTLYNHKIKEVVVLNERIDVYDIEVPGTHNFALASGVFVHNSAKQGRDRRFQAILPLKGKILNVEKARLDKMLNFAEVKAFIIALGTAIADSFDLGRLRYHKIILMTDADVDGAHIRTLLLTLLYRHFPKLIEMGHVYIAQPPLYRIQKNRDVVYAYDDADKARVMKMFKAETEKDLNIQRYKGLGEMNPDQLWETTLNPERRMLKQVTVADAEAADHIFDVLMGEEVLPRKNFIQTHALSVKDLDV